MGREEAMKSRHLKRLLYQALETEQAGTHIYETAIHCAVNDELKHAWEECLAQTENHETILRRLLETLGFDPDEETQGRAIVRHLGASLVYAMELALESADATACELTATECVALAETQKHLNWELIRYGADYAKRELGQTLAGFHREMEREGDDRLFQSSGWSRELWLAALGLPSLLQPLEELDEVTAVTTSGRATRVPPAASRDSLKRL
jgi:hypothetical protein